MSLIKKLQWWGYLDDRGIITVKPYINDRQLMKCEQMPFCRGIFDPIEAWTREEAHLLFREKLTELEYYEKKSH